MNKTEQLREKIVERLQILNTDINSGYIHHSYGYYTDEILRICKEDGLMFVTNYSTREVRGGVGMEEIDINEN